MKPLAPAIRLFDALHEHDIRYCHWKSNEHLLAGLAGETDLDILFDRRQFGEVTILLAQCGFRRFDASAQSRYPSIEDHIGWDCESGRLLHCHAHFQLVAGEPHLKGYRLPWESLCLASRCWNEELGVYVADPNLELLMLLVRYATKLRFRDGVLHGVGRRWPGRSFDAEYAWLLERIDRDRTIELCRALLGGQAVPAYTELITPPITPADFTRFRKAASVVLSRLRSHGAISGRLRRWSREASWLAAGMNRRYFGLRSTRPMRRTSPAGGLLIAVVGCDGSGKSSLTQHVTMTLGRKLDVCRIYFGSGDGSSSLLRWPLKIVRHLADRAGLLRARASSNGGRAASDAGPPRGALLRAGRVIWALTLSLEKRERLRRAWRARDRGMIVMTDRYPQAQLTGFNDGPLLADLASSRSALLRAFARWEAVPYRWADEQPPDVVLRLDIAPDVAEERKPETGRFEIERRVRAIRSLRYRDGATVVNVDANQPFSDVCRDVRAAIWRNL
jgi:thymidylate kinase